MAKTDDTAKRHAALTRLLPIARDLHEKLGSVLDELDEILGGGAGMAQKLKAIEAAFEAAWAARYSPGGTSRYIWRFAQDRPNMKRLLKALTVEEIESRIANYIRDEDAFYTRARHPFGLFVSSINSHASAATAAQDFELGAPAVSDCRHSPACKSDQEHTRRKMAEARG